MKNKINKLWDKAQDKTLDVEDMKQHELQQQKEKIKYTLTNDLYKDLIAHLERCLIMFQDNPKIKDEEGFYDGVGLESDTFLMLRDLKK